MRELSPNEESTLASRRTQFDSFVEEGLFVLTDFVERLELPNPHMVLVDANAYLSGIDEFIRNQAISAEDRVWVLTRIGYFIGEWLIQDYGGCWYVNDIPDTRYFLRYVVGRFTSLEDEKAMVDPFFVAATFIDTPCPRDLSKLLAELESELKMH